jgi:hypothetical protein
MDKVIEQLKKLYAQRKVLDGKISTVEAKLLSSAKAAAKAGSSKVSKAKDAVKKGKTITKAVRAKVKP